MFALQVILFQMEKKNEKTLNMFSMCGNIFKQLNFTLNYKNKSRQNLSILGLFCVSKHWRYSKQRTYDKCHHTTFREAAEEVTPATIWKTPPRTRSSTQTPLQHTLPHFPPPSGSPLSWLNALWGRAEWWGLWWHVYCGSEQQGALPGVVAQVIHYSDLWGGNETESWSKWKMPVQVRDSNIFKYFAHIKSLINAHGCVKDTTFIVITQLFD